VYSRILQFFPTAHDGNQCFCFQQILSIFDKKIGKVLDFFIQVLIHHVFNIYKNVGWGGRENTLMATTHKKILPNLPLKNMKVKTFKHQLY